MEIDFSLPESLIAFIQDHPEIDWNEILRLAIEHQKKKILIGESLETKQKQDFLDNSLQNSKWTEEDALEWGERVKEEMYQKKKLEMINN